MGKTVSFTGNKYERTDLVVKTTADMTRTAMKDVLGRKAVTNS